jgi:hypothetical protein
VTWALDASLRTDTDYVGFVFADEQARRDLEPVYASSVARRIDATGVVVVGIRRFRGRRSIVGTVLDLDSGKSVRTGAIAIEPAAPSTADVRALAAFLAGGRAARGVIVEQARGNTGPTSSTSRWPWLAIGGGVLALAGGVTLVAIDDPEIQDGARQETFRDSRVPGLVLAAGGAVVTSVGAYLLWRNRRDERATGQATLAPIAGESWGIAVVGRF